MMKSHGLIAKTEKEQILMTWNNTQAAYSQEKGIHELFEEQVARTPNSVAVIYEEQQLTYQELNQRANQMARYLQKLEVGPETLVGVCLERSLEMVVGLLGILKAGGAYVPLDPSYPQARLAFMLADSGLSVLLTQEKLVPMLAGSGAKLVLESAGSLIAGESVENLPPISGAANLAYVIYTSGSTGKPKGVQVQHAGMINFLTSMRQRPGITDADTLLSVTTLSFDIAGLELYLPLTSGARLVLVSRKAAMDGFALLEKLQSTGVTVMQATPATWRILLDANWQAESTPSLKILSGGEALPAELARQLRERSASLWNMYGPTETTIWSTIEQVDVVDGPLSIGRPITNTQVYILDTQLNPVPPGVPGELFIGGDGLARGYLNRPDLTAEKFIPNPFVVMTDQRQQMMDNHHPSSIMQSENQGSRLYRTGDLARYRHDGKVEFLGRIDHQIKIHGFRIELGEIEAVLTQHPAVRECIVLAREDIPGNQQLVGYVTSQAKELPTSSELRRFLKDKLPDYMLPAAFVMLDGLPLTPNGKLDRKALPAPQGRQSYVDEDLVPPSTEMEIQLAKIWADVLGVNQVGIHDRFFELGGDSLLGMRLILKASRQGIHLTFEQLNHYQTIAALASLATQVKKETILDIEPSIVVSDVVPMTSGQRWFFEKKFFNPNHWNISQLYMWNEANQNVDLAQMAKVVQFLLVQHDALRSRFVHETSGWRAFIAPPDNDIPFLSIDISHLSSSEHNNAIGHTADQLHKNLNLTKGPLIQVAYFKLGANRPGCLLFIAHHLVIDAVSMSILWDDFRTIYEELKQSKTRKRSSEIISWKDAVEKLDDYSRSTELRHELNYWLNLHRRPVPLPVDLSEIESNTVESRDIVQVTLSVDETSTLLRKLPVFYNCQMIDALLMAMVQTITQWTGGDYVQFSSFHSGRNIIPEIDLSHVVGNLAIPGILILRKEEGLDPIDVLMAVKKQLQSIPHWGLAPSLFFDNTGDTELSDRLAPLLKNEIMFNYLGQQRDPGLLPLPTIEGNQDPREFRNGLLNCSAVIVRGRLFVNWRYSKSIHQRTTIEKVAHDYIEVLRTVIRGCQSSKGYTHMPETHYKNLGI